MNDQHPALYSTFQWLVPGQFNIAQACLQRWSTNAVEGRRLAFLHLDSQGHRQSWSYTQLADMANRLSNGFLKMGVLKGERVAVIMDLRPEALAACLAIWAVGGIVVPLSPQLGSDGLLLRLRDAGARSIVADASAAPEITHILNQCPDVQQLVALDFQTDATLSWRTLLARESADFKAVAMQADDPALLLYTAGTTGMPKGVLHAHRVLIGILPAFVASQNWYPDGDDLFWSPLHWTTAPGLLHGILAALYFGRTVLTTASTLQGAEALELLARHPVTHTIMLPSDLALMQEAVQAGHSAAGISLRALSVVGEMPQEALLHWASITFGTPPNTLYGLTEAPGIVGNSHEKWPIRPGSIGRAIPGHRLAVLDSDGHTCRTSSAGQLALHRNDVQGHPDPCLFLAYWNNESLTRARFSDDWFLTGDMVTCDKNGYFWFIGRSDDVFRSGGYRVSPMEIENCLKTHPAVLEAAIVPKPAGAHDHAIKAFVVLRAGSEANEILTTTLQRHVGSRLAKWQVPQEIEVVERLPLTRDGQIRRHVLRAREQQRSMLASAHPGTRSRRV